MKKLLYIILALSFASCEKYVDDAYLNPNASTVAAPGTVLPPIIANMARGYHFDSRYLGRYVQYWGTTAADNSWSRMGYSPGSDAGGEKWRTHYWNSGLNVLNMIEDGEAEGKPEFAGAGNAILAHGWLTLTDYHGDVILKEAFNTSALTFKYDSQEEVYQKVLELCDVAIAKFDEAIAKGGAAPDFITGDEYLNKGDLIKWKKYVYGIKAKTLHRYSLKSSYQPDEVIKAVDQAMTSPSDDVVITFENNPAFSASANFFGQRRQNLQSYRMTDLVVRYMDGTVFGKFDPRLSYLIKPSTDGVFRGVKVGVGEPSSTPADKKTFNFFGFASSSTASTEAEARSYFKNQAPYPIMTYVELQFIKAEAAFIKGDKTTALACYKKAIQGSFDMLTNYLDGYVPYTQAQVDEYINAVSPASANELTISQLMMQKYIALWGFGFEETWVDMRRYKYSTDVYKTLEVPDPLYPDNSGKLVYKVRPRYNSEYLWNVDELKRIGGDQPDYHTGSIWFAEK